MMKPLTESQIKIDALIAIAAKHAYLAAGSLVVAGIANRLDNQAQRTAAWNSICLHLEIVGSTMTDIVAALIVQATLGAQPQETIH
jgi:hypothetical protein